ncbi:phage terminase small subunit P27 family [Bacillus mycoides]|uniref:phage terminase small subunit P27 family n=1 Tax=Bacillus mycoides TaxID=1405 RepID=UPI003D6615C4
MARPREPVDLVVLKGKKHLTKAEIESRKSKEIKAPSDKIRAPSYLPKDLRRDFKKISDELIRIEIMANLDVDALARYLISRKEWIKLSEVLSSMSPIEVVENEKGEPTVISNDTYKEVSINHDRFFKQCRAAASDLGLTVTSRCKLVVPKQNDDKPKNKFSKYM